MLTPYFYETVKQVYGHSVETIAAVHYRGPSTDSEAALQRMFSGYDDTFNKLNGNSYTQPSPTCCGVGEIGGNFYPYHVGTGRARLESIVVVSIIFAMRNKKGLLKYYQPAEDNSISQVLTAFGFVRRLPFYNPNSGNNVWEFELVLPKL